MAIARPVPLIATGRKKGRAVGREREKGIETATETGINTEIETEIGKWVGIGTEIETEIEIGTGRKRGTAAVIIGAPTDIATQTGVGAGKCCLSAGYVILSGFAPCFFWTLYSWISTTHSDVSAHWCMMTLLSTARGRSAEAITMCARCFLLPAALVLVFVSVFL